MTTRIATTYICLGASWSWSTLTPWGWAANKPWMMFSVLFGRGVFHSWWTFWYCGLGLILKFLWILSNKSPLVPTSICTPILKAMAAWVKIQIIPTTSQPVVSTYVCANLEKLRHHLALSLQLSRRKNPSHPMLLEYESDDEISPLSPLWSDITWLFRRILGQRCPTSLSSLFLSLNPFRYMSIFRLDWKVY